MIDPAGCLSRKLGPMEERVRRLIQDYTGIWNEASARPVPADRIYPPAEKKQIERELSAFIDGILAKKNLIPPGDFRPRPALMEELADGVRAFSKRLMGRVDLPLDTVYDARFVKSTQRFLEAAREFDPEMEIASVFQALRNVWIMNTLQFAFDLEIEHSGAVFGYSMIYPYLDNLLDDESVPVPQKLGMLVRLRKWLEGAGEAPQNERESKLRSLIGIIESCRPRRTCPGVYQSMLAIFNGQIRSLLQHGGFTPLGTADILDISLDKGGTSVIADGYLVAGHLTPGQEDFCFGFGAFLQMADDLQDITEDLRNGHQTLFSQGAAHGSLDTRVHRLFGFMNVTLDRTLDPDRSADRALRDIISRCCTLMAMESAGKQAGFFSPGLVRAFQEAFPVRFSYLRKLRRTLEKKTLNGREKISDLDPVSTALLTLSSRALALDGKAR